MQSVTIYNNNSFLLTISLESLTINIGNFPFGGEPFPWSFPIKSIMSEGRDKLCRTVGFIRGNRA